MDNLKIVYKLYALEMKRETIELAGTERFSRVTPFYVLIYTAGDAPKDSIELSGSETKRLSDEDERWLLDCNIVILREETEKREPEIIKDLSDRVERLEAALAAKRKELEGGMTDGQ